MRYTTTLLLGLLLVNGALLCQEGFKVGADAPVVSFLSGDISFNPAVGVNLRFPYGFDNNVSVGAKIGGVSHHVTSGELVLTSSSGPYGFREYRSSNWTLLWLLVEGKYIIGDSAATRPFISGEIGVGYLIGNWDNELTGFAVGCGAGVEHLLADRWSMNAALDVRYLNFSKGTIGGASARFHGSLGQVQVGVSIGLTYHIPR
jgi:opacity protein-like surface antigen